MIFHRLEAVVHCVEKGEWPCSRRYARDPLSLGDSRSSTPLPGTPSGGTPKHGAHGHDYYTGLPPDGAVSGWCARSRLCRGVEDSDDSRDFKVHVSEVGMHVSSS